MDNICVVFRWRRRNWYSLAPLIAVISKMGFPVRIIKKNPRVAIKEALKEFEKVVLADSFMTPLRDNVFLEIQALRKALLDEDVLFVAGGPHSSGDPFDSLQNGFDYVCVGEGEVVFPELLSRIAFGNKSYVKECPSIAHIVDNELILNTPLPKVDLDEFQPYSTIGPLMPPIEIMRGCAFRCRFCQVPSLFGNPRFRSIENIKKIVEAYVGRFSKFETVDIRFIAPNALEYGSKRRKTTNVAALKSLVKLKDKFDHKDFRIFLGSFPSEIRPESVTEEVVSEVLVEASNKSISVGIQSGSPKILEQMKRGHTIDDGYKALDSLRLGGFHVIFDFILGSPGESEKDQWMSLDLITEFSKSKAQVRLHHFIPLPGTPWASKAPSAISRAVRSEIGKLTRDGIIVGVFDVQARLVNNTYRNQIKSS